LLSFIARSLATGTLAILLAVGSATVRADTSVVVPPLPLPGPYPVACSNVTQDFSRVSQGESASAYWEGIPRDDGTSRYVTDLLSDPANTLALTVNAPTDGDLYGAFAGHAVAFVVLVCYPTAADNSRPDYVLPTGKIVPRMQRGAEAPLLPDATTRLPLLLFSHGLQGSPLSSDYIDALKVLASFGYVVAAPFHGDARFFNLAPDSLSDALYLLLHLRDFLALQALRPLSLSATIDLLLAHPQWRDHIDPSRIGGFGASLGGESTLLMAGAGLTSSIGESWSTVTKDSRLKAAVGYVPYFGQPIFPAFGRDQHGLDGIALPYLAISGTADTTAPITATLLGVNRLAGPRELIALVGVTHGFDIPSTNDIFTWTITFLDAEIRGDPAAVGRLLTMTSVAGGGDDHVIVPYNGPTPANYGGQWWNAPAESEAGWGLNVAHQGDVIFATWFTYDRTGKAWWLSMTANRMADGTYTGTLYQTSGPAFDAVPFGPAAVTRTAVGTGTLTFSDANNGTFAYTVIGITQAKPITRQVFGPVPICIFGAQPNLALATNFQDLWWNSPPGSESGWGINLTQQGDVIFVTWFTYDQDGTPLWLSATATKTAPATYAGTVYRTSGPAFNTVPFNPMNVQRTAVGSATFVFADGNNASFAYTINGVSQMKLITREVFTPPGTVCQ
jgi:predicted dienelactone hydrolase